MQANHLHNSSSGLLLRLVPASRRTALTGIAVLVIAASLWLLRSPARSRPTIAEAASPAAKENAPALLTEAVLVRSQYVQAENQLSGQVEPYHVAVIAAEVANRIVARPVSQGDAVHAGQLLAALDSEATITSLRQAEAAKAQATAVRRQAETDYQRAVVETDANHQQALAQVSQATADAAKARAQLQQATAGERKTRSFTRAQEQRQAESALSQANTDEKLARIELSRYTYLVRQGASPQQELDRAQATFDAAVAKRESAQQAVSLAKEGARQEDQEAAAAQTQAAKAQVDGAAQQVESALAGLRIANTRNTRLAVLRRQIESLKAQEAEALEAVRQARIALDKRQVRAPFAGRILATLADKGDMTAAGTPVVRLGETRRVKVTFAVPEASRPALHQNQPVVLTADALPNQRFAGRITALGYQADPRSRAFPIEVTVQNPSETLLPNMVARLRLSVGRSEGLALIPASAVTTDGEKTFVYVLQADRAVRRDVHLGAPHGNDVEVIAGVTPGEQIAATPQRLSDGATVRVASEK